MAAIYLDNNATTRVAPEVVEAMLPWFSERFGNPSSKHHFGVTAARAVKQARRQVQELLGATHRSEIVFTSGGTESNVSALRSALSIQPERREIITTAVEHPAVLETCQLLEQTGYTVHTLKVDGTGRLDLTEYQRLLSRRVALVSVMWANNETGTLFPVETLAEMAHDAGVMFHTDAVQAAGKLPINLSRTRIDMLSLSGHKLHAPKGIGVLYLRCGIPFQSLLLGGHQERGRRAGTENTPAIVALGRAAELAMNRMEDDMSTVGILRDRLERGLLAAVAGAFPTGDPDNRLPNTANIAFELGGNEHIPLLLDRFGVAASSGSACSSGSQEPSHVMRAMGVADAAARGAVRFSLSRYNTAAEIDPVIDAMIAIVEKLRRLSPPNNPPSNLKIPSRPAMAQARGIGL